MKLSLVTLVVAAFALVHTHAQPANSTANSVTDSGALAATTATGSASLATGEEDPDELVDSDELVGSEGSDAGSIGLIVDSSMDSSNEEDPSSTTEAPTTTPTATTAKPTTGPVTETPSPTPSSAVHVHTIGAALVGITISTAASFL